MSLSAIGYFLLAVDLARKSRESANMSGFGRADGGEVRPNRLGVAPGQRGTPPLIESGRVLKGLPTISADRARRRSGLFSAPAKGTLHKNVPSLQGRINLITKHIRDGARDPAVRATAIAVLSRRCGRGWCVAEKDWEGEAKALFDFVRANVRYTRDTQVADTYVHPARTLFGVYRGSGGGGDCDDYAITLGALLASVGHGVTLRVGAVKNPGERPGWNHIWLVANLPSGGAIAGAGGRDLPLDASVDKPAGWEAPKNRLHRTRDFKVV